MQVKLIMIIGCLGLLSGCSSTCGGEYAWPSFSSGGQQPCEEEYASEFSSCQCADPGCGLNPCLSGQRCCTAFGNVGASNFEPIETSSSEMYSKTTTRTTTVKETQAEPHQLGSLTPVLLKAPATHVRPAYK